MRSLVAILVLGAAIMSGTPARAETVMLYAAGSLNTALSETAKAFEAATGNTVATKFGPSGLLRKEIADGAKPGVFASANMEHPQSLANAGKSGPVTMFARNKLCALVKPALQVDSATLLAQMLDEGVKLGTSKPKADPSGDYAFEVFAKADGVKPGAKVALEAKALKLTGAADSAKPPQGKSVYGWHVAEGRADIFLTYCTNALAAQKQNTGQQIVELPAQLSVGADYGLTVVNGASAETARLAQFILSSQGQAILARYGFAPPK
jgi:molybdenum ABC transporter molybdate-binding protein